jgi:hypothetical protein
MRIRNVHQRVVAGEPQQVARLIDDFAEVWPGEITPPPTQVVPGVYAAGPMVWEEVAREGAARAFRVTYPPELEAEHWFEIRSLATGTRVRHVVSGEAHSEFAFLWRDRLEPLHNLVIEALLRRIAARSVTEPRRAGS